MRSALGLLTFSFPFGLAARLCVFTLGLTLSLPVANATPYEVLYDANTDGVFPEDVSWQRKTVGDGAHRAVEDGIFTLTAQNPNPNGGSDQYHWPTQDMLNPAPGEMFYAEWRLRVVPGSNSSDIGIVIVTDGGEGQFNLAYSTSGLRSGADNFDYFVDTTLFRTYRFESMDMADYSFYVDGVHAWSGFFVPTTLSSRFTFGDRLSASASASQWDYVKFGVTVIPEPAALGIFLLAAPVMCRRRYGAHSLQTWRFRHASHSITSAGRTDVHGRRR